MIVMHKYYSAIPYYLYVIFIVFSRHILNVPLLIIFIINIWDQNISESTHQNRTSNPTVTHRNLSKSKGFDFCQNGIRVLPRNLNKDRSSNQSGPIKIIYFGLDRTDRTGPIKDWFKTGPWTGPRTDLWNTAHKIYHMNAPLSVFAWYNV